MNWSAAPDRDSLPADRRAETWLAALVRMGYFRTGRSGSGRARLELTAAGRRLLGRIVRGATAARRCRICGGPADPARFSDLESKMKDLEAGYEVEISMTLCCIECLDWPDYVLRRVGTLLRGWQSGGRPRTAVLESWQVGEMEVSGFLDARSRRVEFSLEVSPRGAANARPGGGDGRSGKEEARSGAGDASDGATRSSACRTG